MNRRRVSAVVQKDVRELFANRMAVIPMIVVPLVICVLMPTVATAVVLQIGSDAVTDTEALTELLPYYPVPPELSSLSVQLLYMILNYTFVPLFMLVPLMTATLVAANSIVGEKERHTLETLLYTPLTNRELLTAKLLAAFIPALLVTFAAFALFAVAVNVLSLSMEGVWLVRSPAWIAALLLLNPAVSLLGLGVTLLVSLRAKSFMEAQQTAGLVVATL